MCNVLALLIFTLFLVNCSEVGFKNAPGTTTTQSTSDGGALGEIDGGGGPTNSGGTVDSGGSMVILPKIQFIGPPCVRGSNCSVTFKLVTPQSEPVEFDWHTHDTYYQQTPPAGKVYAQPNVHYIPTGGHTRFEPGETQKTVYVQNINPFNYEVIIGVKMTNCLYGQYADVCSKFFKNWPPTLLTR